MGYKRTLDEVAGDWAMAKGIEATETEDKEQREYLMDQILAYNREDLEAALRTPLNDRLKSKGLI